MGRGQRREVIAALSRIAPDIAPAHRDDLDEIASFLGTSVPELLRVQNGYTTVATKEKLGVSLPTVHAWLADGFLPALSGPKDAETRVDRGFVDKLAEALDAVRVTGTPKHLLRDVAALLESKEFAQQNPDIARRLRAGKRGERAPWREVLAEVWGPGSRNR